MMDIQDVYYRMLRNLLGIEHVRANPLKKLKDPVVMVAEKLTPSDMALMDFKNILGVATEHGNESSHVAIITRTLGIPAVTSVPGLSALIRMDDTIILDGYEGKILVNPDEKDITFYREERYRHSQDERLRTGKPKHRECVTRDGIKIRLEANTSTLEEAKEAFSFGADGIGLLRTEFFYLFHKEMPTIEQECNFYNSILKIAGSKPVTVRLLDLGADKSLPYLPAVKEENPQLGCRGIRFLLKYRELFLKHLRSIIRAGKNGNIKILIPFVATMEDLDSALDIIGKACNQESVRKNSLEIGIMVEIPSVAVSVRPYADKTDFLSIGTNDLVQYLFAANRENADMENYRQNTHPALLSLIGGIVSTANSRGKKVTVCGEIASDPEVAGLLVGLGVHTLSMQPKSITPVREKIYGLYYRDMKEIAEKSVKMESSAEVISLLKGKTDK